MGRYGTTTTNYSSIPAANLEVTINGNVVPNSAIKF